MTQPLTLDQALANMQAAREAFDAATASGDWDAIDVADMNLTIAQEQYFLVRDEVPVAVVGQQAAAAFVVVLHLKDFGANYKGEAPASLEGYLDVALVQGDDIDKAYELTNTIHSAWYDAPTGAAEPLLWVRGPARSTSVGDVLMVITVQNGESSVKSFVVAPFGFTEFDATGMVVGAANRNTR